METIHGRGGTGRLVLLTLDGDVGPSVVRSAAARLGIPADAVPRACRTHGPGWISVHLDAPCDPEALGQVRRLPGVARAVVTSSALASRDRHAHASTVTLRHGVTIGPESLTVMAGPCSVESENQILEIAAAVKAGGARVLRGGVFKPRTSPYAFAGLGPSGLEILALAGERERLPVLTEALEAEHVDQVARHADIIQIGSRNMHNFPLLFRAGSHPSGTPVLLKRGFSATLDEFVLAAEYVLLGRAFAETTDPGLILCERGIRTFEPATRFTLDIAAIPILKERTHLPVIADPSHAAGSRRLVPALALASVAAGADGLLLEVHGDPDRAWSDGAQTLAPPAFAALMERLAGSGGLLRTCEQTAPRPRRLAQPV